jgi:uncharacterized protein (DUF1330 family)
MNWIYKSTVAIGIAVGLALTSNTAIQAQSQSGPAYLVVELDVTNQEGFAEYNEKVPAVISQYGGKFIVGGVAAESVEGAEPQGNVIIVRFDSLEKAKEWMNSPEYQEIVDIRRQNAETRSYLVEGLPEG